jgi:hypothetical protein
MTIRSFAVLAVATFLAPAQAIAYPGGTPNYQTNVAPFCASCHSSRSAEVMAGAGDRAEKELVKNKHLALILEGKQGYADLSPEDRATLADQIRALDAASTVTLEAPATVKSGQSFQVTVSVTGGAGPVVGVALVDRRHRWYARPAPAVGWSVAGPPVIIGPDGQPQNDWLNKRPDGLDRNLSFVNVTGVESDSALGKWASAKVVFTLQAPAKPGTYPLAAVFFYGTEKSTVLGYTTDAVGWRKVRGGTGGPSGRLLFTPVQSITVQ